MNLEEKINRIKELLGVRDAVDEELAQILGYGADPAPKQPVAAAAKTKAEARPVTKRRGRPPGKKSKPQTEDEEADDLEPEPDEDDTDEDDDDGLRLERPPKIKSTDPPSSAHEPHRYECGCGFRFRSTIAPHLVRCPECRGKPEEVE